MGEKWRIKYMVLIGLVVIIGVIFTFYKTPRAALAKLVSGKETYTENTRIGNVLITEKDEQEVRLLLKSEIEKWQQGEHVVFSHDGKEKIIPKDVFTFDIETSISSIQEGENNALSVELSEIILTRVMREMTSHSFVEEIDIERLNKRLLEGAKFLSPDKRVYELNDYLTQGENRQDEVISSDTLKIPKGFEEVVSFWVREYGDITLQGKSHFSFLKTIQSQQGLYSDEEWSFIATALYQVMLKSNVDIIERQIGRELPLYTTVGYEAKIVMEKMDFTFLNVNSSDYRIVSTKNSNGLEIQLIGYPLMYTYDISVGDVKEYIPSTSGDMTKNLPYGESVLLQKGKKGCSGTVYRQTRNKEGFVVKEEKLYEDFYAPISTKELQSSQPKPTEEVETPLEQQPGQSADIEGDTLNKIPSSK